MGKVTVQKIITEFVHALLIKTNRSVQSITLDPEVFERLLDEIDTAYPKLDQTKHLESLTIFTADGGVLIKKGSDERNK